MPQVLLSCVEEPDGSIETEVPNTDEFRDILTRDDMRAQVLRAERQRISILLECSRIFLFKQKSFFFMCIYCNQKFLDPAKLREHNLEHEDVKPTEIKRAIAEIRGEDLYKADITDVSCKLCQTPIDGFDDLITHLREKHNKKIDNTNIGIIPFKISLEDYQCVICSERYMNYKMLSVHMNVHYPRYVCKHCGIGFVSEMRLKAHATRHEPGSFPCKECGKVFSSKGGLYSHNACVHKKTKKHPCPHCPEKFTTLVQRLNHLLETHGIKREEFKCTYCPKVYNLKGSVIMHIRATHFKEKNHACNLCDAKFFSKSDLSKHMVMHGGEKIYQCTVCPKAYSRNYHLNKHMRIHGGQEPKQTCTVCGKKFFTNCELQDHAIKHGGEKVYHCEICKKSYSRPRTLREHMRIHNNDRRFICPVCGQSFIQNCSLKQHIRVHHPENLEEMV